MKKDQRKGRAIRRTAVCTAALTMALQLCFSFTSLAYYGYGRGYDSDYPYQDDPDYGSYYYWDDSGRKVTNVTRTYDDGTTYTAQYKYDALGHLVYSNVKKPDGSKHTKNKVYNGELPVSESVYEYDGVSKTEMTDAIEYGAEGYPAHEVQTARYKDGTSESEETWFLSYDMPLKIVATDKSGVVTQTDYTYNEDGRMLTAVSAGTDGSFYQEERQYDEQGYTSYYKISEYDAYDLTAGTEEMRYEGEGDSRNQYTSNTVAYADGTVYKSETWRRELDNRIVKRVLTDVDGAQTTENYAYDPEGNETLYTKTDGSKTVEKRETTRTSYGSRTVETDSRGYTSVSSEDYDPKTGKTTSESRMNGPEGYYTYRKVIRNEDYSTEYAVYQTKYGDGTESYYELSYNSDGSIIKTERFEDGTAKVTTYDSEGNTVGCKETLADGAYSETIWQNREDGRTANEVKRYSDGSEDRIDYEYDESGKLVRETETRRNGVSAVREYQYSPADGYISALNVTFSNGYYMASTLQNISDDVEQTVMAYSVGDVAQVVIVYYDNGQIVGKTTYRDGRTEDFALDLYSYDSYLDDNYGKLGEVQKYYDSFMEQAWNAPVLETGQPETAPAADSEAALQSS